MPRFLTTDRFLLKWACLNERTHLSVETSQILNDNQRELIKKHLGDSQISADGFADWCTQVEANWDTCLRQNGTKLKNNQKGRGTTPVVKQIQP